jgi:NADH-quinone oxidoreductase subunit M
VGEFLIMVGAFIRMRLAVVIAVVGVILEALYMLWTYERVMFGPIVKAVNETISDLTGREIAVMVPVIALMLILGIFPRALINRIEPSVTTMLARANFGQVEGQLERPPSRIANFPIVTRESTITAVR